MALFYRGGIVSYQTMRDQWRVVTIGILTIASLLPKGIFMMFIVSLPAMLAYGSGLAFISVTTLGERYTWARTA